MEVDPNLIGGVVIRAGDMVIDASIRGRLNQMAQTSPRRRRHQEVFINGTQCN